MISRQSPRGQAMRHRGEAVGLTCSGHQEKDFSHQQLPKALGRTEQLRRRKKIVGMGGFAGAVVWNSSPGRRPAVV